ncbi:MAG: energy-coupled thiamine transporter ThiT [Caldicoprobacterales bacterium]|jgi:thiamine transporter|nr:energy-coupled thiamine transporter ThiT [Clostridiales bacterium]
MSVLEYLQSVFSKLSELKPVTIAILIACILAFIIYLLVSKKQTERFNAKIIVYAGLSISVSFVLSYLRLYRWPQGGSITPASMLPLFVFAHFFGAKAGITAGAAYGLLNLIQDPFIVHWVQVLLDYILAYAALGIAGYFKNIHQGIAVGGFARFFFSFLSGVVFFGQYAPEGMNVILYSILVNLLIIGTETIICLVVSFVPQVKNMIKTLKSRI